MGLGVDESRMVTLSAGQSPLQRLSEPLPGNGVQKRQGPVRGGVAGNYFGASVVAAVSGAFRDATQAFRGWMGPGMPLRPQTPPGFEPRTWDYPTYRNVGRPPRDDGQGTGVTFDMLRNVADACTIVRLCIETRKDQISKLDWQFRLKPKPGEAPGDTNARSDRDPRIAYLEQFFLRPDREHTFSQWIREVAEQALVYDSTTLYRRPTIGGDAYALEVFDGTTINKLTDQNGRTPQGVAGPDEMIPGVAEGEPIPAYQQWIKGIPAWNFGFDELLYYPRNPRAGWTYGYGPVEQLIVYVNLALRRTMTQSAFYTDGNLPGALLTAPESWAPDTIKRFQDYWTAMLNGTDARRHQGLWVPFGTKVEQTVTEILKDEWDEWLARVVCFCFSISPNFFIRQMNRASAQTFWEQADAEGLEPWMDTLAEIINEALYKATWWEFNDIEFSFMPDMEEPPERQVGIDVGYVEAGIWTKNEVRKRQGMDPIEGGDAPDPNANPALLPHLPSAGPGGKTPIEEAADVGKVAKYSDDEPRDDHGRWTAGGSAAPTSDQTGRMTNTEIRHHAERNSKESKKIFDGYKFRHQSGVSVHQQYREDAANGNKDAQRAVDLMGHKDALDREAYIRSGGQDKAHELQGSYRRIGKAVEAELVKKKPLKTRGNRTAPNWRGYGSPNPPGQDDEEGELTS